MTGKTVIPYRPFVMKEGMTLDEVRNAQNLSAESKKYIAVFDADGNGTFNQREADVFNATSINTTFWGTTLTTTYKNGEIKYSTLPKDISTFKYAPQGEIKIEEPPVENIVKDDKKEEKEILGTTVCTKVSDCLSIVGDEFEGVEYSKTDKIIAGIEFQEGIVKDVQKRRVFGEAKLGAQGDIEYIITLTDGSSFDYSIQDETNKAKVYIENGTLVFKGVRGFYFNNDHYDEEIHEEVHSNLGKYKFIGCKGFVNTIGQDGETITTAHRVMADGVMQQSSLLLCSDSEYLYDEHDICYDEKFKDHFTVTESDTFYFGN